MKKKLNQTNLFLIMIAVFLPLPRTYALCTFKETSKKIGDNTKIKQVMPGNKSKDECKKWCLTMDNCIAVDHKDGVCFRFEETPPLEDNPTGTHFDKTCGPDACSMVTRLTDTKGTSSSMVKVAMSSVEDCRGICKYLGDCEAVSYTSGVCSVYSGVTPTTKKDSVDYQKVPCSNGKKCCMDKTCDKKGNKPAVLRFSQTVESCEKACLNYDNCEAVHYKDNVCYFHLTTTTKSDETGSTFSLKSCPGVASDGTAIIKASCTGVPSEVVTITEVVITTTSTPLLSPPNGTSIEVWRPSHVLCGGSDLPTSSVFSFVALLCNSLLLGY